MTVIPNLLVTGILAVFVSLALLVWSLLFVHRQNGGWIMIILSVAMLLVGGGIFPPILAILIGAVATRINTPRSPSIACHPNGFQRVLANLWPWSYSTCIIAWLSLLPGIPLLAYFFGVDNIVILLVILFLAFGTLFLNIFTSSAYDFQVQSR